MKVAILAGGVGSRLVEETEVKPKPMVEIGGMPILWHIMKHYAHHGFTEFVIALGYRGEYIKRWFTDFCSLEGDMTVNTRTRDITIHNSNQAEWTVHLVDTGQDTLTGGRIKRLRPWIGDSPFLLTWGDGVADIDIPRLVSFHQSHGRLLTLTAVRPPARFGHLEFNNDAVVRFSEKPQTSEGWINGAFFVCEPRVFEFIEGDQTQWEREPLENIAAAGELMAYRHSSFWQCMDTLRDKKLLQNLWDAGNPPWKIWS
jgi:glucose-1-phosphate cytidylyltransferase